MTAWLFPAGDVHEREAVAIHRLTNAAPPRSWSVDVNRKLVKPGDYAILWQTGGEDDLWRPGVWAVGFVDRYDPTRFEVHWARGAARKTTYAQLELWWTPIIDRELLSADANDQRSAWAGSTPGNFFHGHMRSPLSLTEAQADWILDDLSFEFRKFLEHRVQEAIARSASCHIRNDRTDTMTAAL